MLGYAKEAFKLRMEHLIIIYEAIKIVLINLSYTSEIDVATFHLYPCTKLNV